MPRGGNPRLITDWSMMVSSQLRCDCHVICFDCIGIYSHDVAQGLAVSLTYYDALTADSLHSIDNQ
jgi:hypothetical protein